MFDEKIIYFYTEYGQIERFIGTADSTKIINPNVALGQCRLILEILLKSIVRGNGNLNSRIRELERNAEVDRNIIEAMDEVRFSGNVGVHSPLVPWQDADRALKKIIEIMQWYCDEKNFSVQNKDLLAEFQFSLAKCYEDGVAREIDFQKCLQLLHKSADNGNAFALRNLGGIYFFGRQVTKNPQKGVEYLQLSMSKGSVDSEVLLALLYGGDNKGIEHNLKTSYDLLSDAVSKGSLLAEYVLIESFNRFKLEKLNLPYNPKNIFSGYKHIIETGYDNNLYKRIIDRILMKLGDCYQYGLGTNKDLKKSFESYFKASERGNVDADYKIAQCYEKGIGVEKNMLQAEEFYIRAAMKGHKAAEAKIYQLNYDRYIETANNKMLSIMREFDLYGR